MYVFQLDIIFDLVGYMIYLCPMSVTAHHSIVSITIFMKHRDYIRGV